ncbi:hypothetical protein IC614_07970 [Allosphingosinicella flava]|uniref:Uncharacterized protein n=1 Tax=Allosphingosinicella flava TaxID=2771430 RepID=A0A7T2LLA4_9SPHN|nr:hypothetical protein [Sphingosinicella flava]QPQ54296.1 hypothetical protein IC614_07970 [Sphingosinicella flava]
MRGSDGVFRPFILYGTPNINLSPGKVSIRLGQQTVGEGEAVTAVGQIVKIDEVRAVSDQITPEICGEEGVMIRRFVKNVGGGVQ